MATNRSAAQNGFLAASIIAAFLVGYFVPHKSAPVARLAPQPRGSVPFEGVPVGIGGKAEVKVGYADQNTWSCGDDCLIDLTVSQGNQAPVRCSIVPALQAGCLDFAAVDFPITIYYDNNTSETKKYTFWEKLEIPSLKNRQIHKKGKAHA